MTKSTNKKNRKKKRAVAKPPKGKQQPVFLHSAIRRDSHPARWQNFAVLSLQQRKYAAGKIQR